MRKLILLLLLALPLAASDLTYILKRGADAHVVMGNMTINGDGSFEKLINRWSGDYLWTRIGSREYLIRDAAVLAAAKNAFAEVDAHQVQYHAVEKKMRPLEKRQDELERKMDYLSDKERLTDAEERQLEQLEQQLRPVEEQLRVLEREEERLDQRQELLEQAAERKLRQIIEKAIRDGAARRL